MLEQERDLIAAELAALKDEMTSVSVGDISERR